MRVVEISCWLPAGNMPASPAPLVTILADVSEDFVPRRFGAGDPAPQKADVQGQGFAAYWTAKVAEGDGIISWRGRPPALQSTVFVPSSHQVEPPGRACGRIFLRADADRLEAIRVASLLSALGNRFSAIYGSAWVLDGYTLRGGALISNADGDEPDEAHGATWIGLPPTPPWLAWYGIDYASIVADTLGGNRSGSGLLVGDPETYAEPARYSSWEESASHGRYLPSELLARRRDHRFWRVPPSIPAVTIPDGSRPLG